MKYEIRVTDISYGYVTVEADSKEEAAQEARQAFFDGKTFWDSSSDFELSEPKEVPEKARGDAR